MILFRDNNGSYVFALIANNEYLLNAFTLQVIVLERGGVNILAQACLQHVLQPVCYFQVPFFKLPYITCMEPSLFINNNGSFPGIIIIPEHNIRALAQYLPFGTFKVRPETVVRLHGYQFF